jgi:hypothetical protein
LGIPSEAAGALLLKLRRKKLFREIAGRLSFRVFELVEIERAPWIAAR